ncbi:hypothetical protein LEP1GSC039_1460 [Leptospira santarosai str. 2000027870]|nr:hypothetical protein LEP1GSC039_1460 [Leptospira santarosai str. 2000027870]
MLPKVSIDCERYFFPTNGITKIRPKIGRTVPKYRFQIQNDNQEEGLDNSVKTNVPEGFRIL